MIISDLLSSGSKILKNNKVKTHQLDSEIILTSILKKKKKKIKKNSKKKYKKKIIKNFNKLKNKK